MTGLEDNSNCKNKDHMIQKLPSRINLFLTKTNHKQVSYKKLY